MSRSDPGSWLDSLVGACFSVLVGAVALFVAVRLVESVWIVIVLGFIVCAALTGAIVMLRRRSRGW